ncbi:MAG: ABC transporter ATP-binding protein [Clostridiales bacterium]|nr:ABC transporter ATP-binding protein [Clostridiales bacterium]
MIKKILKLTDNKIKKVLIFMIILGMFQGFIMVLFSDSFKSLIDYFINFEKEMLTRVLIEVGLVTALIVILEPILVIKKAAIIEECMQHLRIKSYNHVRKLPVAYFDNHHSGDLISRMNKDIESTKDVIRGVEHFIIAFIALLFMIPYFIYLDLRFAVIAIVISIIMAIINIKFIKPMRNKSKEIHKETAILAEAITENVTGFRVIKLFLLKPWFLSKFDERIDNIYGLKMQENMLRAKLYSINALMWWISQGGLAVSGIYFVINGSMEASVLVGGTMISGNMAGNFMRMFSTNTELQKPLAGLDRLVELFAEDIEPEKYSITSSNYLSGVYLENLSFNYIEDIAVLNDVNINVKVGQVVALVGNSGGGKSTIIKLLMGLYEANSGMMTINAKPINEYSLDELRNIIAYVPQDAYIFNGTVYENVLYGKNDANMDEIVEACKKANAHDFISSLKDGYDTKVGERGIKLSGGQRQRVAIARAILKNAPILLLDEATSSLDSESEQLIQEALLKLMVGKTSIVVAHRLSTIENADNIFYIKDGTVVEDGTHSELLLQKGLYAELYYKEFGI